MRSFRSVAIEFLGFVFSGKEGSVLDYGAGIALPIAALALFLGVKRIGHRRRLVSASHHGSPIEPGQQ